LFLCAKETAGPGKPWRARGTPPLVDALPSPVRPIS